VDSISLQFYSTCKTKVSFVTSDDRETSIIQVVVVPLRWKQKRFQAAVHLYIFTILLRRAYHATTTTIV
jgi:hypothetical protein